MAKRNCCLCGKVTVQHRRWLFGVGMIGVWYCLAGGHVAAMRGSKRVPKNWG